MISAILLSAGLSQRFGSPKALADFEGKPLINRLQVTLLEAGVDELVVVLGAAMDEIKPHLLEHKKVKFVYNKDYNLGQTSSFQTGLGAVSPSAKGILLLPVDFPLIQAGTIEALIKRFKETDPMILIPVHEGRKGHPPIFSATLKKEFLALPPSEGINTVAHRHESKISVMEVADTGVLASFNTPEELARLLEDRGGNQ